MGNYFSNETVPGTHEQFAGNHTGGPVTQHTVYDYTQSQQFRRQTDDYRRQVDDLVRENNALKHYNQALRNEMRTLNQKMETQREQRERQPIKASISTEHIKTYVDEMLKNSDINIYGFPDAIEKQIYRNVFNMLLNVLDHTLDTSEVKLFGHKIVFDIQPLTATDDHSVTATATAQLPETE
jgi:regulator of replication initiation timing